MPNKKRQTRNDPACRKKIQTTLYGFRVLADPVTKGSFVASKIFSVSKDVAVRNPKGERAGPNKDCGESVKTDKGADFLVWLFSYRPTQRTEGEKCLPSANGKAIPSLGSAAYGLHPGPTNILCGYRARRWSRQLFSERDGQPAGLGPRPDLLAQRDGQRQ